jgi:hypothetical protein
MMRWCECGERVSVPSLTSVCPDCQESKRVERAVGAAPITLDMLPRIPPEREPFLTRCEMHIASVISPDWKSLLVTSSKLAAVATASRATAATLRAVGGPVAETIAARADETARVAAEASLMAIAESAVRWFERSTESSR